MRRAEAMTTMRLRPVVVVVVVVSARSPAQRRLVTAFRRTANPRPVPCRPPSRPILLPAPRETPRRIDDARFLFALGAAASCALFF
ncbi:hypothetical protein CDD83_7494 [Cordyceps sp. RAO-2017]|nr:hypothetical protein CDD83_7494 [Cordyceps sp. RAO-2017]